MSRIAKIGNATEAGILDPGLFPDRLSFDEGLVSLVPTTAHHLREATFLDSRSQVSTGPPYLADMDAILYAGSASTAPARFIFHVSFCGSTLLSRLLDVPSRSLVLREPQCLADLASRRAMLDQTGAIDPRIDAMIAGLPRLLSRPWHKTEAVVIKPSNWTNNLAPALCTAGRPVLPVFLTAAPRAFLRAVLRGGSDRIAFTARVAVHLSQAGDMNAKRVARALEGNAEQTVKLMRLAALTLRMQNELFAQALEGGGWNAERCLDFEALSTAPVETAIRAAGLLDLGLSRESIAANADRWIARNAKQPDADYSISARASEDRVINDRFGAIIEDALAWAAAV